MSQILLLDFDQNSGFQFFPASGLLEFFTQVCYQQYLKLFRNGDTSFFINLLLIKYSYKT